MLKLSLLLTLCIALTGLIACGGGGGGDSKAATRTGVFKDTNVSGLRFQSGGQHGVTDALGRFTYEVGRAVDFYVGDVSIGAATGGSVITPIDLVTGGSTDNLQVQNIVRFLLMLDTDGDSDNGISISTAVQELAQNWPQVDFSTANLGLELASIITEAGMADGTPHALPDAGSAKSHLESTLLCSRAGGFRGNYQGDDSGPFGIVVDAQSGLVSGVAYSNEDMEILTLTGSTAVGFDQAGSFISGDTDSGSTFSGAFDDFDRISGSWDNAMFAIDGTFSGRRVGGANDAVYRFTGSFSGDAHGLFTFDIDGADQVSGVAYTVSAPDGTSDELSSFSGSLVGTNLSANITDNGEIDATITATLDKDTGTLSNGTWSDADQNGGTFTGSGCQLNTGVNI